MMNRYRALLFPFHLVNLPQLHKRRMVRQRRTRILCASCATCDRGTSSKPIQESNLHPIFYQILRDSSVAGWPHLGVTDFVRSVVYIQSELKRAMKQISGSVQQKGYAVPKKFLIQPMHYGICEFLLGYKFQPKKRIMTIS